MVLQYAKWSKPKVIGICDENITAFLIGNDTYYGTLVSVRLLSDVSFAIEND